MPYLISRYFGFRSFGEIYGYMFSAFTLGLAVGPVVMGFGFDIAGSYRWPLSGLIAVLGVAIAIVWTLPPYDPDL
jgi:MFS family permease